MKNKFSNNILIDAILLVAIVLLSFGSFIMEWFVPCGGGHCGGGHGIGHGISRSVNTFCGLDRHTWGSIHMYIGIIFILFILYHIFQHRGMVCGYINKRVASPTTRNLIYVLLVVLFLVAVLPWIGFLCC